MRYPEHEKLAAVKAESQAIGEFIEFSDFTLCVAQDGKYVPTHMPINEILAEWFGIDSAKLEEEKRTMLEQMRDINAPRQKELLK